MATQDLPPRCYSEINAIQPSTLEQTYKFNAAIPENNSPTNNDSQQPTIVSYTLSPTQQSVNNNNFAFQHIFTTPTNIWLPKRNQILCKWLIFP